MALRVCLVPGVYDDAYAKAIELRDANGYTFIHPFDDENVIAGQGTIGLEILSQVADADVIVVPVGGGGLISGVAFTVKQLKPSVRVYGVQAEGAPSMVNSLKDGKIECLESVHTIADGIKVKSLASIPLSIAASMLTALLQFQTTRYHQLSSTLSRSKSSFQRAQAQHLLPQ